MANIFKNITMRNALLSLYTIMVFALIIYLSLLYNAANALMTDERFTVQAIYSVGIASLVAFTGATWLMCGTIK